MLLTYKKVEIKTNVKIENQKGNKINQRKKEKN